MHEIFRNFTLKSMILLALANGAAACGAANAEADETAPNRTAEPSASQNNADASAARRGKPAAKPKTGDHKKGKSADDEKTARESSAARPKEVMFENLADFINDEKNHKAGERFVVNEVPTAKIENVSGAVEATGNPAHRGLIALDFNQGADGSGTFLTSVKLARNIQANGNSEATTLRVTVILIETAGDVDVYRSVFVTKIEGLSENGELAWTAVGDQPAKLRFGF